MTTEIHPTYRMALEKIQGEILLEGPLEPRIGRYHSICDGAGLHCEIQDYSIVQARHSGGEGALRPLLEGFCREIIDLPVQEAAEHGVLTFEANLRSRNCPAPVLGVITPMNADPLFLVLVRLVRDVYRQWQASQGIGQSSGDSRNVFTRLSSARWAGLTPSERLAEVSRRLPGILDGLKIKGDLKLLTIRGDTRLVFERSDVVRLSWTGRDLMAIERELKTTIEPQLELVLEGLEDQNHREGRGARREMKRQ